MGRVRIAPGAVVDAAIELIDREGFEALNLSAVAVALDVRPSALYSHIDGIDQLHDRISVTATNHLTSAVSSAAIGIAGTRALDAMGHAYRGFAHINPGQYASILRPAAADNVELVTATHALDDVFSRVYLGAGMSTAEAGAAAGGARSAIHGFVALEHASGTTPAHDQRYRYLLDALHRGLDPT